MRIETLLLITYINCGIKSYDLPDINKSEYIYLLAIGKWQRKCRCGNKNSD